MKEIRMWKIDHSKQKIDMEQIPNVANVETENLLEEIITVHPEMLMEDLKLIGRQTDTVGGPLDLLGVDGDGNPVVFELKKGKLTREAVAQIIDYSSFLSSLDSKEFSDHISSRSGKNGIDKIEDFRSWYQEQFGRLFVNMQKPRMVLVGLGADEKTKRMVSFLSESALDISLTTFHGFKKGNDLFLSKQIEVSSEATLTQGVTKTGNLEKLKMNVKKFLVEDYYYDVSSFLREQFPHAYEWPNPGGFSYAFQELTESGNSSLRVYVALYINESHAGSVEMYFHKRAIESAPEAFQDLKKSKSIKINAKNDGGCYALLNSLDYWQKHQHLFETLCPAISSGWKAKLEQQRNEEFEAVEDAETGESDVL